MADTVTVNYDVIEKIDIATCMKASGTAGKQERSISKTDSNVWANTVSAVMESEGFNPDTIVRDTSKQNVNEVRTQVQNALEKAIYAARGTDNPIPETGTGRDGKSITLLNEKTGKIKWSSWDETRRMWSYSGDIAKALCAGLVNELYPEKFKVGARCDILKLAKSQAGPMDHIKRLTSQLAPYLDAVTDSEAIEAQKELDTCVVSQVPTLSKVQSALDSLDIAVGKATANEKETVRTLLAVFLDKHFAGK